MAAGAAVIVLSAVLVSHPWGTRDPSAIRTVHPATSRATNPLIERLRDTRLVNGDEILARLRLDSGETPNAGGADGGATDFLTDSPYFAAYRESFATVKSLRYSLPYNPQSYELNERDGTFFFYGRESVLRWYGELESDTGVCGVRFLGPERNDYRLRSFAGREAADRGGYVVTHRHHCGTCSSLRDLAVYMGQPDLVTPVSRCARRTTPNRIKACLVDSVGFTEPCAETWTYNVLHTRRRCLGVCIEHYGLWKLVTNDMAPLTDGQGSLNPCLACDEHASGPGFKYAAGRTRRGSGLTSAIERPAADIHAIDHGRYFD